MEGWLQLKGIEFARVVLNYKTAFQGYVIETEIFGGFLEVAEMFGTSFFDGLSLRQICLH
jgi:hypothetical protein